MDISVIIPYHNEAASILTTLDLMSRQTYPPKEVILVDSASTDASYEIIQNWIQNKGVEDHGTVYLNLRAGTNVPGSSKNAGIRIAKSSCVALMDCGLIFDTDWLEKQIRLMEKGSFEVVSGGVLLEGENIWDRVAAAQTYGYKRFRPCVPSSLAKKSIFEKTGLFLEKHRAGYDVDWPMRLESLGISRGINQDVVVRYNGVNYADSLGKLFRKSIKYAEWTVGIHRYYYPYFYLLLAVVLLVALFVKPVWALVFIVFYLLFRGYLVPAIKSRNLVIFKAYPISWLILPLVGLTIDLGKLIGIAKGLWRSKLFI